MSPGTGNMFQSISFSHHVPTMMVNGKMSSWPISQDQGCAQFNRNQVDSNQSNSSRDIFNSIIQLSTGELIELLQSER